MTQVREKYKYIEDQGFENGMLAINIETGEHEVVKNIVDGDLLFFGSELTYDPRGYVKKEEEESVKEKRSARRSARRAAGGR